MTVHAGERLERALCIGVSVIVASVAGLGCDDPERRHARVGQRIFQANCSPCHGTLAEDDGPRLVPGTSIRAPDLRRPAQRWGDPIPRDRIAAYIDGRADVAAHGPRTMPVWGDRLFADWPDSENRERARAGSIDLLVDYIESRQVE